jgi:hypothetical protein
MLALAMACAALAWRDCMLMATSLFLAHRLLLLRMAHLPPRRALAAAVEALSAGLLTTCAGFVMLFVIAAAWLGWWQPMPAHASALVTMLSLGALWCCLHRGEDKAFWRELRPWLWLLGGSAAAAAGRANGYSFAPCLFVAVVAMSMIRVGWRLATVTASALLHTAGE